MAVLQVMQINFLCIGNFNLRGMLSSEGHDNLVHVSLT